MEADTIKKQYIGKSNNPTIEFTDGNKDVKINFTIETVELPKGMTAERAARTTVPGGKVVDSKNIRLKYTADGNQLEIEYDQNVLELIISSMLSLFSNFK